MEDENKHILHEPQPDYEKAEMDQLREALKRTYTERFFIMTKLMRRGKMLKTANFICAAKEKNESK